MKRITMVGIGMLCLLTSLGTLQASTQSGLAGGHGGDPLLPLDNSWTSLDENMSVGDFFTGPWTYSTANPISLDVTDWAVVSDRFEVYLDGALVLTTPAMPNWVALGEPSSFTNPPYAPDADTGWARAEFSKGSIVLPAGLHDLTFRDIYIPPTDDGSTFADGTIAFRAEELPEPASLVVWATLGLGLVVAGYRRRFARA